MSGSLRVQRPTRRSFHTSSLTRRRGLAGLLLIILSLLLMACPKKNQNITYDEAERGLRLAININEVAYNSWNRVYENMGQLHRIGRISEARWAAVNAIDGVLVLSEADLIEGIERSKKLLALWKNTKIKVLSAESASEVNTLRERETEARLSFVNSVEFLNLRSMQLRDSYSEALNLAVAVNKDNNTLPSEPIAAIKAVVKLVDVEIERARKGVRSTQESQPSLPVVAPVTVTPAPKVSATNNNDPTVYGYHCRLLNQRRSLHRPPILSLWRHWQCRILLSIVVVTLMLTGMRRRIIRWPWRPRRLLPP
ncbi:MAG: hypothetical protein ACKV2V_29735 [Blastocatellia bacterium]